jgi:ubiquinone/menaquinone biosynthesis C-methylase UbiE
MNANQYDAIARDYETYSETNAYNALCERPATLSLLKDVAGKVLLDAACGPGFYAAFCEQHGAEKVLAFDGSPNMVALARKTLSCSTVFVHDLGTPLPFIDDNTLDGIVCALALEYVQDLNACLLEFFRMLTPGGFLVCSIENPWLVYQRLGTQYWDQEVVDHPVTSLTTVQGYRRPLAMYLNGLADAGFLLQHFVEAKPVDRCQALFPDIYRKMLDIPFFLSIRAQKRP